MAPLRCIVLASLAALAVPAGARAALLVDHQSTSVVEQAPADGIVGPGDTLALTETLLSSEPSLTGVTGRLSAGTAGVTVGTADAPFPDAGFGQTTANSSPFSLSIGPSVPCGTNVSLALDITATQGSQTIPLTVGTGARGAFTSADAVDVPQAIPDGGSISSSLQVAQPGLIKDVRIRIGRITHTYVGDLKVSIEAPDGTTVVLINRRGGSGDDIVGATFATSGASVAGASAPFTGTWAAEGDLSRLVGHQQQGTWTLHVSDMQLSDTGTLSSWGADAAPAVCSGNPIPSVTATPNPVAPGAAVTLDASASIDPNGSITRYEWDLDGDGVYELDTLSTPSTTTSFAARGSHVIGLRVTDNQGNVGTTTLALPVTNPPVAALSAAPSAPLTAQTVTLDASGSSDPDGPIARYEWDLDGNGTFERDGGASATTSVSFATPGKHTVRVRVTDGDGATAVAALDVAVGNRPPVARLTVPALVVAGRPATLDAGASSDPEATLLRYEWDLDGDGTFETATGTAATVSGTWPTAGSRTVAVRVTDADGASAVATVGLAVDALPLPALSATPSPAAPGQVVAFSAAGSADPDGAIVRYEWDLDGDGVYETDTGTVPRAERSYPSSGTRTVRLRVTDDRGAVAEVALPLSIAEPAAGGAGGSGAGTGSGDGGAATPGGAGGGGAPSTVVLVPGLAPFTAGLFGAPIQALRLAQRRGLTFTCRTAAEARCAVTVLVAAREAQRLRVGAPRRVRVRVGGRLVFRARYATRVVGRAVAVAPAGTGARMVVALSAPLRRALIRARSARLLVRGVASDVLGRRVTLARVVLLRR